MALKSWPKSNKSPNLVTLALNAKSIKTGDVIEVLPKLLPKLFLVLFEFRSFALFVPSSILWTETLFYSGSYWAVVVVAQLVELPLPTPEVRGLNPVTGDFFEKNICLHIVNCIEKTKKKEKEAGIFPFFKKINVWSPMLRVFESVCRLDRSADGALWLNGFTGLTGNFKIGPLPASFCLFLPFH